MEVLRSPQELSDYLEINDCKEGCLADTGYLYGFAYDDDRLHEVSLEILDILTAHEVPVYSNVISRLEFVDLIFRKQVTQGAIQLFGSLKLTSKNKNLINLLKDIRDKDSAARKRGLSYKVDERRMKRLREFVDQLAFGSGWQDFCSNYIGDLLVNEWVMLEEDLGLNFVEIMEGDVSGQISESITWSDMVSLMGERGLRGPDAMIINLFSKSKFSLLISGDKDFENCLSHREVENKSLLLLC